MSDRHEQARAEAERQYETGRITFAQAHQPGGFVSGVEWADANPQPTTITRAQFRSAYSQFWIEDDPHDRQGLESMQEQFLNALGIEVEGDEWVDEPLSIDRLEVTQTVKMSGEPMNDNSKAVPNGSKDLDFFERARALDAAATAGPWGVEGSRFGPEAYRNGQAWGLNWRQDLEWVAAARSMLPAAVEALARVRELHRKYGLYELEDACTNTSEEHRQERHHEASDDVGEFFCEDMPVGAVCDTCRDEDGERMDWPCETYKATEVDA